VLNLKTFVRDRCVSTVELPMGPYPGGYNYETLVFKADGHRISDFAGVPVFAGVPGFGARYRTEEEARRGHAKVCERLEAGEPEE
jgi:hypothetical protein